MASPTFATGAGDSSPLLKSGDATSGAGLFGSQSESKPRSMPTGPAPRRMPDGSRVVPPSKHVEASPFTRDGAPSDGYIEPRGNPRHVFEKRETPLCFMQPYYNPTVFGHEKVPNQPHRITPSLRSVRGEEVCGHGERRVKEVRKLPTEYKARIKALQEREKREEAERNRQTARLRWWHTRQSVELRDLLKTMKFNNYTFQPELLLNAKDVVILNLTGCRLGDRAMEWVSTFMVQNGTLRRLILQGNRLTAEGVDNLREGIRKNHNVTDVDLSLNPIGDAGLNNFVSAMSENRRNTKISKVNFSTCNLTPSSGYHLARLIRDFKTVEVIYAWRNRLGVPTDSDLAGVGLILDELAVSKTLKHIDLSANCLSEDALLNHATVLEQQARVQRLEDIKKKTRKDHIEQLESQVREMKSQELWEDEKVILAGLERELALEKQRYEQDLIEDARVRKMKTKDFEWVERVHKLTGRDLEDPKVQVRMVIFGNHSVTPMTVSRLSQFYDLNSKDDTEDWITRIRKYDRMVKPRRQVGQDYEYRTWEEAAEQGVDGVWDYEADMLRIEEEARAERARELDELRKKGVLASDVLEARLRGRTPNQRSRSRGGESGDALSSTGGRTPRGDDGLAATPGQDSFGTTLLPPGTAQKAESDGEQRTSATRGRSRARGRSRQRRGASPAGRDDSAAFHSAISEDLGVTTGDESSGTFTTEQSDAELFNNVVDTVQVRSETRQRRGNRRVRASRGPRDSKHQVGLSTSVRRRRDNDDDDASPRRGGGGGESAEYTLTIGDGPSGAFNDDDSDSDSDDDVFGRQRSGQVDAFDDAFDTGDEGASSPMAGLLKQLVPRTEENTASGMQRKLDERMEEVRERMAAKAEERRTNAGPAADDDGDGAATDGAPAPVTVTAHHQTGELIISVQSGVQDSDSGVNSVTVPADEDAAPPAIESLPEEVAANRDAVAVAVVTDGIAAVRALWENIKALSEIGSPTEDDLELLNAEREKLANLKRSFAKTLAAFKSSAQMSSKAELVGEFAEELIRETDRAPGTTDVLRALTWHVDANWPTIVADRALGASCAVDGSTELLTVLLAVPNVEFDVVELVCSCFFNQAMRIPLTYQVLTASQPLPLADWVDDLQDTWQEFFEDIASQKRAIPREDRDKRLELLETMLRNSVLNVDAETEGADGQTLFSRACVEGDLDVVQMLVGAGKVTDINAVRSDGMTALHSAVIGNNADLVKFLLNSQSTVGEVDVNIESPNGNALDLAMMLQRDGRIAASLKEAGAKGTAKSAGKKPKPKGKANVSVGFAAAKLAARAKKR